MAEQNVSNGPSSDEWIQMGFEAFASSSFKEAMDFFFLGLPGWARKVDDDDATDLANVCVNYADCLFNHSIEVGNLMGHAHYIVPAHLNSEIPTLLLNDHIPKCLIVWDGPNRFENDHGIRYYGRATILDIAWAMLRFAKRIYSTCENALVVDYAHCYTIMGTISFQLCNMRNARKYFKIAAFLLGKQTEKTTRQKLRLKKLVHFRLREISLIRNRDKKAVKHLKKYISACKALNLQDANGGSSVEDNDANLFSPE